MEERKIQWHPAFAAALEMEFIQDRDSLAFEREYSLNRKPLLIDALIIKKKKETALKNEIGKCFETYNVVEYKSMKAALTIDDVSKAQGYAHLLKAYGKRVDEIRFEDVTVTLVRESEPASLFRYFVEHGYRITMPYKGIYYVNGGFRFFTQIIVGKELSRENHEWLRLLSGGVTRREMERAIAYSGAVEDKREKELIDAILDVSVAANRAVVEELMGDEHMYETLMEIMEPRITEMMEPRIREREQRAAQESAKETAEKLIKKGKLTLEDIADCTGLPLETVKKLEQDALQFV